MFHPSTLTRQPLRITQLIATSLMCLIPQHQGRHQVGMFCDVFDTRTMHKQALGAFNTIRTGLQFNKNLLVSNEETPVMPTHTRYTHTQLERKLRAMLCKTHLECTINAQELRSDSHYHNNFSLPNVTLTEKYVTFKNLFWHTSWVKTIHLDKRFIEIKHRVSVYDLDIVKVRYVRH